MALTSTAPKKARMRVFRAKDAPELSRKTMQRSALGSVDEQGFTEAISAGIGESAVIRLLFEDEASGVSLTYAWFRSHVILPRHSHSADCLYYVVSGSLRLGTQQLESGDGFLVPGNSLYTYEVGEEGVEVLEFRTATTFDISYKGTNASWAQLISNLKQWRPSWSSLEPPPVASKILSSANAGHNQYLGE